MKENPYHQDKEDMRELVKQFQNLKAGRSHSFIDEEAFEKIIDYFDDVEDFNQALEADATYSPARDKLAEILAGGRPGNAGPGRSGQT